MCAVSSSEPARVLPNGNYRRRRVNQIALDYYKTYIIIRLFIVRADRCKFSTRSLVLISTRSCNASYFKRRISPNFIYFTRRSSRNESLRNRRHTCGGRQHGVVSTVSVNCNPSCCAISATSSPTPLRIRCFGPCEFFA